MIYTESPFMHDFTNPYAEYPKRLAYSRADVSESLADWLCLRANLQVSNPSPIAEGLIERGARIADISAHLVGTPDLQGATFYRTLTSDDFGSSLSTAMARIVGVNYQTQAQEHRRLCMDLPTKGLKPVELPIVDLGEPTREPGASGPVNLPLVQIQTGGTAQPYVWSSRVLLSRELLIGDDAGLLGLVANQLAGHAARIEAAQLAGQINDNVTLGDGSALIGSGNSTVNTGLDVTSLNEALGLLRTTETPSGNYANLRGRFLLVPPDKEATALILADSTRNGGAERLGVIANAWLSGSDAYLLADPAESAVFVRSFPASANGLPEVERIGAYETNPETGGTISFDGIALVFRHLIGVHAVSRQGIVKLTAA